MGAKLKFNAYSTFIWHSQKNVFSPLELVRGSTGTNLKAYITSSYKLVLKIKIALRYSMFNSVRICVKSKKQKRKTVSKAFIPTVAFSLRQTYGKHRCKNHSYNS